MMKLLIKSPSQLEKIGLLHGMLKYWRLVLSGSNYDK